MRQPDNLPAFCRVHRNGRPLIARECAIAMRQNRSRAFVWVRCVLVRSRVAGCRRCAGPGASASQRTGHEERGAAVTPAGRMSGGGPPKKVSGCRGFTFVHSSAQRHLPARVEASCTRRLRRQGAAGPGRDQGSGARAAVTPAGTGCRKPCKQHGAHRRAVRERCPASARRRWSAGPGSQVSAPQPARIRRRAPAVALVAWPRPGARPRPSLPQRRWPA
jgi:hypothetical protein